MSQAETSAQRNSRHHPALGRDALRLQRHFGAVRCPHERRSLQLGSIDSANGGLRVRRLRKKSGVRKPLNGRNRIEDRDRKAQPVARGNLPNWRHCASFGAALHCGSPIIVATGSASSPRKSCYRPAPTDFLFARSVSKVRLRTVTRRFPFRDLSPKAISAVCPPMREGRLSTEISGALLVGVNHPQTPPGSFA